MDMPAATDLFLETEAVRMCRAAIELARRLHRPTHVVGKPGTGKSTAFKHLAVEMKATYCEADYVSKSTKGLYELLLEVGGYYRVPRTLRELHNAVLSMYAPSVGIDEVTPQLVIVDEVQTLEATAFRELLRLQERCPFYLVVAGNGERLTATDKERSALQQIESRLLRRFVLPGPSRNDCALFGTEFNVEGKRAYDLLANFGNQANVRRLVHLLETAQLLAADEPGIRMEHLTGALELIEGKPNVLDQPLQEAI